jgi:hypothetical protein
MGMMGKVITLVPRRVLNAWKAEAEWRELEQAHEESQRRIQQREERHEKKILSAC